MRRERPPRRAAKNDPVDRFLVPRAGGGTAPVPPGESLSLATESTVNSITMDFPICPCIEQPAEICYCLSNKSEFERSKTNGFI